jgi:hypothetical protein
MKPGADAGLRLAHSLKREIAHEVIFTGERMLVRNRGTEVRSLG